MTDSAERPRVLSAASRSILFSNRRIVTCKSSAYSFSAATISTNQDARVVAVTVPDGLSANHQLEGQEASGDSDRVVIAVPDQLGPVWAVEPSFRPVVRDQASDDGHLDSSARHQCCTLTSA
jgi:hypothetical protein